MNKLWGMGVLMLVLAAHSAQAGKLKTSCRCLEKQGAGLHQLGPVSAMTEVKAGTSKESITAQHLIALQKSAQKECTLKSASAQVQCGGELLLTQSR